MEGAPLVGSILLAFAIDAWWDKRLERADEVGQLGRLQTGFADNIAMIDERTYEPEILAACADVFDRIEAAERRGETTIEIAATTLVLIVAAQL